MMSKLNLSSAKLKSFIRLLKTKLIILKYEVRQKSATKSYAIIPKREMIAKAYRVIKDYQCIIKKSIKHKMEKNPVYEIPADEYNKKLAEALKQIPEFQQPEWSLFVKSGVAKKRPPQEEDFWHKRAASILRQIYTHKTVGVGRLKTRYGSKQNRGMKPERFKKGSGKIIRTILQQAEKAGLLEKKNEPGKRAGRCLTEKGKELLEGIK